MKKLIIVFVLFLSTSLVFSTNVKSSPLNNNLEHSTKVYQTPASYTYERVLINGKWWMYEYEDGRLVNIYPIDE